MRKLSISAVFLLILTASGIVLGQSGSGQSPATGAAYTGSNPIVVTGTVISCPTCGGSSPAFSALTSGTNTTAAMVVGAGGSLNFTSTGTINASTLGGATFAAPGPIGSTTASTGAFTTISASGAVTFTGAVAASTPVLLFNAAVTTGLTGTTNRPAIYRNATGNTDPSTWSTGDIFIGHNAAASNCSSFLEQHSNGGGINYRVDCSGGVTATSITNTGGTSSSKYSTATNCSAAGTAASPSVVSCAGASAGAFSCATNASGATCTVNTTAAATNSDIIITQTASAGTRLSVTCNTTADIPTGPRIASIVNGTSFTINLGTVATNPTCYFFTIVN